MTYKVAKELKDAGFPQTLDGNRQLNGEPMRFHDHGSARECDDGCIYVPTLSELIEACGNGTGVVRLSDTECNAWNTKLDKVVDDESNDFNYFRGSTPEEAVARLWLALNKK